MTGLPDEARSRGTADSNFRRRQIATKTKHILHDLTRFVYEYLQDIFKPPKSPGNIPPLSPGRGRYSEKQTT
jgi:hypothetical protein